MQAGKANRFRCRSEVSPAFVLCSNGLFRRTTRDATSETDQKLILASGWSLCMEISYEHPGTPSSAPTTPSNLSTDSPFYTLHTFSSVVQTQPGLSSPEALNPSPSPFPTASDTSLYPSDETMDAVPHPQLAGRMMAAMTSAMEMDQQESGKKKRGRPRKYGPGAPGSAALILAPIQSIDGCISASPFPEKKRGRPPGSGKKQHLSSKGLHGQQATSAGGQGFTPHVITVDTGEDVATKIMSFSQIGPRAVCVLSANGAISNVTLRQPATSGGTVTYEGRFEILSLSGSFLPTEVGGTRSRTGGLSVSLAGPDGHVVGGGVAGLLMAASPVQVVLGSFIAEGQKKIVSSTSEFTEQSPGHSGIKLPKVAKNDMKVIRSRSPSSLPFNQGTGGGNHTTPHSPGQSMGLLQSMAWTGSESLP